ncbi:MAG: hypothetical protein LBV01_03375 [Deltaproteobacteria bacterium]|jgi:GT2 family glycosyltransferase|nr:hypothetical protein [Deltaproteobacteria bacterium]
MRLAVCILHYGESARTSRLHRQLLDADPDSRKDVYVLDNAAPEPYPDAWLRLPENRFWGGAFAWALERFAAEGYSHLWFCNNDLVFVSDPPYIARATARFRWLEKRGRVGVYSPSVTVNPYHRQMTHVPGAECRPVMYVDGIAPLVSLECLEAIGGLDCGDNPYGYGADVWLSLRAGRAGWGIWVDHALVLRHKYHAAAGRETAFLALAAKAEDAYMAERLGPDWRKTLAGMQDTREPTQ